MPSCEMPWHKAAVFDLVVVLSPAHFAGSRPLFDHGSERLPNPTGVVELDHRAVEALDQELDLHRIGFDGEHAIEVQLPFLQVTLGHLYAAAGHDRRPML